MGNAAPQRGQGDHSLAARPRNGYTLRAFAKSFEAAHGPVGLYGHRDRGRARTTTARWTPAR